MERIDFGRFRTTAETLRRPVTRRFEPKYALSDAVFEDLRAVERADQDLRRFQVDRVQARRIFEDALTRNAFGTASIEGNPLTLDEVESLLERGPTPDSLVIPDEREILNYVAVMETLPERAPPSSPDEIRLLHADLFRGVLGDAGEFKRRPNFIGRRPAYEVTYIPALPERVEPELSNALAWLRDAGEHPLVKAQVFFHEFQSIHPFRDGNGRTGRALATMQLHGLGYTGVRFAPVDYEFNADREGYYGALEEVERLGFDFTPWIRYMSRVLRRTFEAAVARFLLLERLPPDLPERQVRVAEWFARLGRDDPQRRVKFNDVHAAFPAVAARTLQRDLAVLRERGVLDAAGTRKAAAYRLDAAFAAPARRHG